MKAESKEALIARLAVSCGEQLRRFLVKRVRNVADVSDIIQEIFLRLLRIPDHESIRCPEAYLFTVARHVVQQHTLRQAAEPVSRQLQEMLTEVYAVSHVDPEMEVSAQECLAHMERALEQLSPKARATFLLHQRDGLTLHEIGTRLGISRSMAKKYLVQALVHFRKRLEDTE
ncbi:MAG: sigma-70 family RNA polymerase sigma factor [Proteobacteria bacterium]|nr:sigma-70 family RNA polymerase sigma factor [Pseudomonadota bacterium]